jgi:hypothetical protein
MYNSLSKEILLLMSKHLILPWIKKHRCKQQFGFLSAENVSSSLTGGASGSSSNYCSFCEEYLLWFTFAKDLLIYIAPKQENEIAEVNFLHLLEMINTNATTTAAATATAATTLSAGLSYSKLQTTANSASSNNNSATTTPSKVAAATVASTAAAAATAATASSNSEGEESSGSSQHQITGVEIMNTPKKAESKTDPELGIWVTSYGVYYFKLPQLQPHLQLFHAMLKELYRVPDVDAFYNLLICLKMLVLHGDCLEAASKDQKGFLIYSLEKLLIPK